MKMQKFVIFFKKKIENKYLKDINIIDLEIIVIIQGKMEVLRIAYVIEIIVCLKKFFTMDLSIILILS